jgi:hypothetical protein
MDRLLQEALPWAQQFLTKYGEFVPFAVSMAGSGESRMVAGYVGSEDAKATDLLTLLYDGLRSQAAGLRGAAVVSDVRLKNPESDAIRVEVEHRDGAVITVLLPYRVKKKLVGRAVSYGDMVAVDAERRIWPTG